MSLKPAIDLACPQCHGTLGATVADRLDCEPCSRQFPCIDGIWRFLSEDSDHRPFLDHYQRTRRAEGWGSLDPAYFRRLPTVTADDPHAWIWRIRELSFRALTEWTRAQRPARAVELGAGSGWLSHRLARDGIAMAAVDLSDDRMDGLGAHPAYGDPSPFLPIQASFDRLPMASGAVDAVIFNGSFHYSSDAETTLRESLRVLAPGGWIAIVDSPFYPSRADGQAMLDERNREWRKHDAAADLSPKVGFVCPGSVERLAAALSLRWQRIDLSLGWRWRLKNLARGAVGRRRLASFPILLARRLEASGPR